MPVKASMSVELHDTGEQCAMIPFLHTKLRAQQCLQHAAGTKGCMNAPLCCLWLVAFLAAYALSQSRVTCCSAKLHKGNIKQRHAAFDAKMYVACTT